MIRVDHQACILCDRCIRACNEIRDNQVLGRAGKGYKSQIAFDLNNPMGDSTCVACGECAAVCPTLAAFSGSPGFCASFARPCCRPGFIMPICSV